MRSALLIASIFVLAACNMAADAQEGRGDRGSGEGGSRSYNLAGFNSVSVAGPFDVVVAVGGAHSVRAEGDAEMLDRLEIRVDGSNLEIGTQRRSFSFGFGSDRPKTTIYVTMPQIEAAALAGSGDVRIDRIEGSRFAASVAGSGDIEIAALRVGEAKFNVAGSGGIRAAGNVQNSKVSVAGSGEIDLERLETRVASISVAGSGDVRARATETAKVSLMGSGDVTIAGPAKCSVDKKGSGDVRCTG